MDHIGRVEELEGAQNLVNEILYMLREQLLPWSNHSTQIGLHKLANEVDIAKYISK